MQIANIGIIPLFGNLNKQEAFVTKDYGKLLFYGCYQPFSNSCSSGRTKKTRILF